MALAPDLELAAIMGDLDARARTGWPAEATAPLLAKDGSPLELDDWANAIADRGGALRAAIAAARFIVAQMGAGSVLRAVTADGLRLEHLDERGRRTVLVAPVRDDEPDRGWLQLDDLVVKRFRPKELRESVPLFVDAAELCVACPCPRHRELFVTRTPKGGQSVMFECLEHLGCERPDPARSLRSVLDEVAKRSFDQPGMIAAVQADLLPWARGTADPVRARVRPGC